MNKEKLLFDQKYPKISFVFDMLFKGMILSFLFFLGLVMGLIVFGIGPSFVASKRMAHDWLNQDHPPLFKTFFNYYKTAFLTHTLINLSYLMVLGFIIFNFYFFFLNLESSMLRMLGLCVNIIFFIYVWSSWHTIFHLKYGFDLTWKESFIFSFKYIWGFPLQLLMMIGIHVICFLLSYLVPQIFIFFSIGWILLSSNIFVFSLKKKFLLDEEVS